MIYLFKFFWYGGEWEYEKSEKINLLAFWAGAVGIEPTSGVLETLILPMNYAPMYFWHAYIYTIFVEGCQQNKHIKFRKCIRKILAYSMEFWYNNLCYADVAELADALDLGSSVPDVKVQVLSGAPA